MRALPAAAALALLLLPGAMAHSGDRHLSVEAGYPLPRTLYVGVAENEGCWTHDAFWGAWDVGVEPLNEAYRGDAGGAVGAATGRAGTLGGIVGNKAAGIAADGATVAPGWALDPFAPYLWLYHHVEDEDACLITTLRVAVDGQGLY